jgi:hypothetical protein
MSLNLFLLIINLSDLMKSFFPRSKIKEPKSEPKAVYYATMCGITLVGENLYEKVKKEIESKTKTTPSTGATEAVKINPIKEAKNKLELSYDIDFVISPINPENPFFYIQAFSPQEAKKQIGEYQSKLENGYGIKIDLEKLQIREK